MYVRTIITSEASLLVVQRSPLSVCILASVPAFPLRYVRVLIARGWANRSSGKAWNRGYMYLVSVYVYPFGPRVSGGPALRANVAGRIGNRASPAESAFSALHRIGIEGCAHYSRIYLGIIGIFTNNRQILSAVSANASTYARA